jgi:signal recognition particle GTPase
MTVRANTPLTTPPQSGTSSDRLVYLAAIWARQTGRSIVVSDTAGRSR